ncbi:hypothetical protein TNCV_2564911 [Trichonephila clavipes]|nr:hypothetical protein TNCV_2564911 [Trichonephila clavipes]
MLTSSWFEYQFILLPRETDRRGRLSAGLVFTKPFVQRHLQQDSREESSRTLGIPWSADYSPSRPPLVVISNTCYSATFQ